MAYRGVRGDIVKIRRQMGPAVCLMGNVHCLETPREGTPEKGSSCAPGRSDDGRQRRLY